MDILTSLMQCTPSTLAINGLYSVLGPNYRVQCTKYGNMVKVWNDRCANEEESIRKCKRFRELYEVRDRYSTSI